MNPMPPLLADADYGQVAIVIVALVVGFINWLINLWKQKRETAERERHIPTEEELVARRRVMEEQTRPQTHPLPQETAPPPRSESLKDLFEELKRAAREAQTPTLPPVHQPAPRPVAPPLPAPARPAHSAPLPPSLHTHAAPWVAMPVHGAADERQTQMHSAAASQAAAAYNTKVVGRTPHPLTAMLHTTAGYRQAFVLKEILDTPKGIRGTPWDEGF